MLVFLSMDFPTFETNIYFQKDQKMFLEVLNFYNEHQRSFSSMLARQNYFKLRSWIDSAVSPILDDPNYKISTKVSWILFGLVGFPKCKNCGEDIHYRNLNVSPKQMYRPFCSLKCSSSNEETKNKTKKSCQKKFGVDWPMQSEILKKKCIETCLKNYGVVNPSCIEKVKLQKIETTTTNFGPENRFNHKKAAETCRAWSEERKFLKVEREKNTFKNNLGVEWPMQCYEVFCKCRALYFFDGLHFKSSWELAKYIFHRDHHDDFEYQPNIQFEYFDSFGNKHIYHPDFIVDGEIQEIKGDMFFDRFRNFVCPFKNKNESLDQFEIRCKLYESKYHCMVENNVKIFTYNDVKCYLDYVSKTYGSNFLKSLKTI